MNTNTGIAYGKYYPQMLKFLENNDTFGPFKLVGGINKNRPNAEDREQALRFYRELNKGVI